MSIHQHGWVEWYGSGPCGPRVHAEKGGHRYINIMNYCSVFIYLYLLMCVHFLDEPMLISAAPRKLHSEWMNMLGLSSN